MLELGEFSESAASRGRAPRGRGAGLDLLIGVGGTAAAAMTAEAVARGHARTVCVARDVEGAGRRPGARVTSVPGDLVLVKGSRGIGTDLVVERLKGEFA